jgi:hypothetical protein
MGKVIGTDEDDMGVSGFTDVEFEASAEQRADKTRNQSKRDMTEPLDICTDPNCHRATWFYHKPHGPAVGGPPAMDRERQQNQPRGYGRSKA